MFFERLLQLCSDRNLKITPVLKSLNIATGAIHRWRNGTIPTGDSLILLADYFDVSIDYLLGKTNDPSPNRHAASEDDEFWEMRQAMLERPEMRVLFDLSKNANKKTLEVASDLIKQLKEGEFHG